ncbi:aminoglycoside adenylyltransferase [Bacillus pseudomycoides]|uniref:Aminoglycoside 6-adenylyltransferase n=1 Tax=Bacillus pseudomycoides TaxID=64104 RepID=A0AAJ2DMC5_9BACI|nr:aminoglycoside 6-adenylyltransferase [Bacillus pseudomycoides]EEM08137.1 Aminoglycoside 6-adenylyltransferase [Bacillus pseudomycoides]MCR8861091.1 aminoglycoside 6-adenylyltransferase [Bacillus pseudomycoides]MDR4329184.1 aminoglycoside 6-adenylyltransferase [Bacillus pseudomycoides]MED1537959.1 aminoglycoside 6-adenylyltransferase [Bacillus pseudomycoides]MED1625269.1 aminoglycoside 6-adenylyltransferase [Bacillus pseudomycoides]
MRNEQEMMDLIINIAKEDGRIRAVYMNGSRTNPNVPKDIFQDYDVVYVVTETASFIKDKTWINAFGDLIMMQEPDKSDFGREIDVDFTRSYGFLMLFTDGNRIDLRIQTKEVVFEEYEKDKLNLPLMDKDNLLPTIPYPTDIDYYVKKPSKGEYDSYTNEFWWCLQNVAKGIWRDELPYAKLMFEYTTRNSLNKMVTWWIGIQEDFQVSPGKLGKYFKAYLPEPYWKMYKETYSNSDYENIWESIFITCELFRILSKGVAEHFNFTYPIDDDRNMTKYLKHVRNLPSDAKEIF